MSVSLCPSHNMGDEDYHKTPPLGSPSPRPSTGEDSLSGCTSLPKFGSFAVTFQIQTTSSRIWCICQANIWSIRTHIQNRTCSTKKVYLHQHCTIIHRSIYNGNKKKKKIYKSKHYITSGKKTFQSKQWMEREWPEYSSRCLFVKWVHEWFWKWWILLILRNRHFILITIITYIEV